MRLRQAGLLLLSTLLLAGTVAFWAHHQPVFATRVAVDGIAVGDQFVGEGGEREWAGRAPRLYPRVYYPARGLRVYLEGCGRHVHRVEGGKTLQVGQLAFPVGMPAGEARTRLEAELGPSSGTEERRFYVTRTGTLDVELRGGRLSGLELGGAAGYHRCPGFDEESWLGGTDGWRHI